MIYAYRKKKWGLHILSMMQILELLEICTKDNAGNQIAGLPLSAWSRTSINTSICCPT